MIPTVQITGDPDMHPEHPVQDAYQLASGQVDLSKLRIKSHHTRVFDLMSAESRDEYDKLYVELSDKVRQGKILISGNTRETLTRPDGSTGWFKFVEWTEFDTSEILGAK